MRIVCVWRDNTEYAREVENWIRDFQSQTGNDIESLDPDSVDGSSFARASDIVEYPTLAVVDDRGAMLQMWRGLPLPSFDQVTYYAGTV